MPLITYAPETPPPVLLDRPTVASPGVRSLLTDATEHPLNGLLPFIGGSPFTVRYYSQIVSSQTDLREHDVGQAPLYQQYRMIHQFELRVTTPLLETQDTDSGIVSVTGAALVYPCVIPNVNDYFIGETGVGRDGVFRITTVERKSFHTNAVFSIDYTLVSFADVDLARVADLHAKSIETLHFHKDRLLEGTTALLIADEHAAVRSLAAVRHTLIQHYMQAWYSPTHATWVLPDQSVGIYDGFLVQYLLRLLDTSDAPDVASVRVLNMEGKPRCRFPNLWSMLLHRDVTQRAACALPMGLLPLSQFSADASLVSFRFSGIQYAIYPQPTLETLDPLLTPYTTGVASTGVTPATWVHPVLTDACYVLSAAFYANTTGQSRLEQLLNTYLAQAACNPSEVIALADAVPTWAPLEQFYYAPLVLTLLADTQRTVGG